MTVLGINIGQVDDLVSTLNTFLPKGVRLCFEVEHEMAPTSSHRTLEEALREQRIEEQWVAEQREIDARVQAASMCGSAA